MIDTTENHRQITDYGISPAADQKQLELDTKHSGRDISPSQTFGKYQFLEFKTITLKDGTKATIPSPNEIIAQIYNQETSQRVPELRRLLDYIRQISKAVDFKTSNGKEDAGFLRMAVIRIIQIANSIRIPEVSQDAHALLQTIPTEILPQRLSSEISSKTMKLFTGKTQAREQFFQKVWRRYN